MKPFLRTIRTPEELGVAYIGSPLTAIVPPKQPIDRAEFGRRLARMEGGVFSSLGYHVPSTNRRSESNAT